MVIVPDNSGKIENAPVNRSIKNADQLLWNDFRTGSESAYALIYQQYFFSLYNYGLKICAEREIVKDCIQDLFIYIWKNKEKLKETTSIKYYLFTALKRRLIDNFSAQSRFDHLEETYETSHLGVVSSEEAKIISGQVLEEQKQHVLMALEKLTVRQKEAVALKFYENLSNEDIATHMNISVEGVYNLISKAMARCRKDLSKAYYMLFGLMLPIFYVLFF